MKTTIWVVLTLGMMYGAKGQNVPETRTLTIQGTSEEISVSSPNTQDLSADRTWTLSIPSSFDLSGKGSFVLPIAGTWDLADFGELVADNNSWATGRGAAQFFDGTSDTYLIGVLENSTPSAGKFPQFQSGGTIAWASPVNINVDQDMVGYFSTANTEISNAFFWENTNKTIGIGISSGLSSTESIHTSKEAGDNSVVVDAHDNTGYPRLVGRRSEGTRSEQDPLTSGSSLLALEGHGYDGSGYSKQGSFSFMASENWSSGSARGTGASLQLTPDGETLLQDAYSFYPDRIIVEGETNDSYETTLQFTDPTADRTVTFGNVGGDVPVVLNREASTVEITHTDEQMDLYMLTVPGRALGTTRNLHLKIIGDVQNGTTGEENVTIRIKYGGTIFYEDLVGIGNATARRAFVIDINMGNHSASTQFMVGSIQIGTAGSPSTGIGEISASDGAAIYPIGTDGTQSVNSSNSQTFQVTVQWENDDSELSFRAQYAIALVE